MLNRSSHRKDLAHKTMRFLLISAALFHFTVSQDFTYRACCSYCRADPKSWVTVAGTYKIVDNERTDITAMQSPPAYLVDDEQRVEFDIDSRLTGYVLHYGGAPIELTYEDTSNLNGLLNEQYIQYNLATPKKVGGVKTQGGFYTETTENYFLPSQTWMSEFVISYSNDSSNFVFFRDIYGTIVRFTGNTDSVTEILHVMEPPVVSTFVRIHPIKGHNSEGATRRINPRATLIYCEEEVCATPRINCLLSEWGEWSTCDCSGGKCLHSHSREILRVQACGGEPCDVTEETLECVEPTPAWRDAVIYGAIALVIVIVLIVLALIVFKKTHSDKVEVIVVKDADDDDDEVMSHPAPQRAPPPAAAPGFKPSVPPMAAGYPMMGGPRFGQMPMGPRAPMRPGMGPNAGGNGPMGIGGGLGGVAPIE